MSSLLVWPKVSPPSLSSQWDEENCVCVCTLLGLQFGQTKNEDSAFRSKYVWGSMVCYPQLGGGEESRVYAKTLDRRPCTGRSRGDLFIWFGGPLDKGFQGPFMCCLLLHRTIDCYWLLQWSNPVSSGFHSDQTRARILKHSVEAERRLFKESCLFKGQSVQQGLQWLYFFVLIVKSILCKQLYIYIYKITLNVGPGKTLVY
jgi:hypothetical protein